jgi:hypothetical protein
MSETVSQPTPHTKIRILTGIRVELDLSQYNRYSYRDTIEKELRIAKEAVAEFNDFIRDHRSMDWVSLDVVKDITDVCSGCQREWDPFQEDGVWYCFFCGDPCDPD